MQFVFKIRNSVQFEQCLSSISNPNSPNYGRFLNATTLQPYLPTPGQKSTLARFLSAYGFNVTDGISPLVLNVAGSVDRAERIFGVHVGVYGSGNSSFYAIDSDPTLPQNLAVITTGILGLDNYTRAVPAESPCTGPYCPQGIQVGYSLSSLIAAGKDGTGVKVAVVDAPGDPNTQTAINTFNAQYGLPATTLDIRYPDGTPSSWDPGWASEAAMDVEAVHTAAPGAGIVLLYDSFDVVSAIEYVATHHLATIVSNSWGYACATSCTDTQLSPSLVSSVDSRLATVAAQGVTILFGSGDKGAKPDGTVLGTEFPVSDPNVLAVGATNLVLTGCTSSTCTAYGSESGAIISGGGYSGYFAEPSWQTSTIGTKPGRAVPDVSMLGYSPSFWVYSTYTNACVSGAINQPGWFGCAGSSLSTPLWAGFLAIALQIKGSGSFGNIGPRLYQVASSSSYASSFNDITSGTNGYSAVSGWDPVTGWGTPIASNLAYTLANVPTVTVTSDPTGPGYVAVDGSPITTPQAFTWYPGSTHTLAANSPVPCGSGCQYVYTSWGDGGVSTHSITVPPSYTTYTANFKSQYQLTIALNPSAAGSTIPAVGSIWSDSGSAQSVTAAPASGYSFYYWNLDGTNVGGTTTYLVTMNAPHTLTGFLRSASTISISSPSSVPLGSSVTISGTITSTHTSPRILAGNIVMLSYSLDGGTTWSIFITTPTDNAGSYSVVWYAAYPGNYQLMSSWGGNANYQGATSSLAPLTATGTAPLPVSMLVTGPNSAGRGSSTSFNVLVTNPGSTTMQTTLYLEITGPGGYWYFDTQQITVTVGSTGRFQFDWQVPGTISAGTYVVNVGLAPGKPTAMAQTQLTLT
jgi:hypothetical protein